MTTSADHLANTPDTVAPHIVLLDNVDSFAYNLVDELRTMGYPMTVFRNTVKETAIFEFMQSQGDNTVLLLSPGPGNPDSAGNMMKLLQLVAGRFPVLGICLGYQAIVQHYGGIIDRASEVLHGKASPLSHSQTEMFEGLPQHFPVARYHSLMAKTVPDNLQILAKCGDVPMCVYEPKHKLVGFQFHPESILTALGSQLLKQSIALLIRKTP